MNNKRLINQLFFALLLMLFIQPVQAQWRKSQNLTAGKISTFAGKGQLLFAGTDTGGVYTSTDFGLTWTVKNTGLSNKTIASLLIRDSVMVAGITNGISGGAIFLSKDSGASWISPASQYYGYLFCLAEQGKDILGGTWYGVIKSTNNGNSWTTLPTAGLPSNASVSAVLANGTTIFAGVSGSSAGGTGIFRSTNNGNNWVAKNTGLTNTQLTSLVQTDSSTLLAATKGGGVFISTNNGDSWTQANTGLANLTVYSLITRGKNILAGTAAGLFLSTDNAANWTDISTGLPAASQVTAIGTKGPYLLIGTDTTVWRRLTQEIITTVAETEAKDIDVALYPNPCRGSFKVELTKGMSIDGITVLSPTGQIVCESHSTSDTNIFTVDLPVVAAGVYHIQVKTAVGVIHKRILVD